LITKPASVMKASNARSQWIRLWSMEIINVSQLETDSKFRLSMKRKPTRRTKNLTRRTIKKRKIKVST